ncbi:hypothetical protein [Lewinella sp. LCG006]|uniref:hypothetical protein n=1 Tax=Lewinella sp. LCG006 TaxID=3231911 RepID=UPI00345F1768
MKLQQQIEGFLIDLWDFICLLFGQLIELLIGTILSAIFGMLVMSVINALYKSLKVPASQGDWSIFTIRLALWSLSGYSIFYALDSEIFWIALPGALIIIIMSINESN